MTKHTPGPWIVSGSEMSDVRDQDNYMVACAFHVRYNYRDRPVREAAANARLIAAAPDLLYALKEFLRNPGGDYTEEIAREAIAKATGCCDHSVEPNKMVDPPKLRRAGSFGE